MTPSFDAWAGDALAVLLSERSGPTRGSDFHPGNGAGATGVKARNEQIISVG